MGVELKDFRGRLTVEGDCALDAEARATGRDKSEIVRDLVHEWAMRRIHAAKVLDRLLIAEGSGGIAEGRAGRNREEPGAGG